LLSADVTCASAESIAFWSLSRVFFWFCFAVVMACWSACSVEVRVLRALVSAFFWLVQSLLVGLDPVLATPAEAVVGVVVGGACWHDRRFCSAVLTSAFWARVSVSSLACAFLIAVSVDVWSRSFCFRAVLSVSLAASTDCCAWVTARASCCF
jgi:hypothetical protein